MFRAVLNVSLQFETVRLLLGQPLRSLLFCGRRRQEDANRGVRVREEQRRWVAAPRADPAPLAEAVACDLKCFGPDFRSLPGLVQDAAGSIFPKTRASQL